MYNKLDDWAIHPIQLPVTTLLFPMNLYFNYFENFASINLINHHIRENISTQMPTVVVIVDNYCKTCRCNPMDSVYNNFDAPGMIEPEIITASLLATGNLAVATCYSTQRTLYTCNVQF